MAQRRRYAAPAVSRPPALTDALTMESARGEGRRALVVVPHAPLKSPPTCAEPQEATVL